MEPSDSNAIHSESSAAAARGIIKIILDGVSLLAFGLGMTGYLNPSLGLFVMSFAVLYWLYELLTSVRIRRLIPSLPVRIVIGIVVAIIMYSVPLPHPALEKHAAVEIYQPQILPVEPFVPFHENEIVKLDMRFRKAGQYPVRDSSMDAHIYVRDTHSTTEGQMFSDFMKSADFEPRENILVSTQMEQYGTYYSQKLTQKDVDDLNDVNGAIRLCMVGAVRWRDETGRYETDMCYCMVPQKHPFPASIPAWGQCAGHNGELPLH